MLDIKDRLKGIFFGAIVGDIYGAPYEFEPKDFMEAYEEQYLSGEYHSGGPFNLNAGEYTDDTSMMLCLTQSYIDCKGHNSVDQIEKYIKWYKDGYMSSNGRCFDIGMQTRRALDFYITNKQFLPNDPNRKSSGNGAMMRMAPTIILYHNNDNATDLICNMNNTTHNDIDVHAFGLYLNAIIDTILISNHGAILGVERDGREITKIMADDIFKGYVPVGSGYVKDSFLIAVEAFSKSETFLESLTNTIAYGNDTDTNACITGMLAGAHYGFSGIPENLIKGIKDLEMIEQMFENLFKLKQELEA